MRQLLSLAEVATLLQLPEKSLYAQRSRGQGTRSARREGRTSRPVPTRRP